jgi:hypothetical protein
LEQCQRLALKTHKSRVDVAVVVLGKMRHDPGTIDRGQEVPDV